MIIQATAGPAGVLHRLALAVDCVDALTGRPGTPGVRAGREADPRLLPRRFDHSWPCLDLDMRASGRFTVRRETPVPDTFIVRIADAGRSFAPRRLRAHLWTEAQIGAADRIPPAGPYVPVLSRLLRPWLLPGPAAALSRSATAIRGRVERNGMAVRWPRITALGPGNVEVGWAHGDDRGEFQLVVTGTGTLPPPAPSTLGLDIVVSAPDPLRPVTVADPADRYADLVVEDVPRSAAPPTATDLDNPLLRGRARPPGYVESTGPRPHLQVDVGGMLALPAPIAFAA